MVAPPWLNKAATLGKVIVNMALVYFLGILGVVVAMFDIVGLAFPDHPYHKWGK